jgi:uncharacterized protein YbbC (DUF1343 family)
MHNTKLKHLELNINKKFMTIRKLLLISIFTILSQSFYAQEIIPGAARLDQYLHILKASNHRVGVVCNQTSMVGNTHLIDTLISLGVNIKKIFTPEHGYRGHADAGEKVNGTGIDEKTGAQIISLYGGNLKPNRGDLIDLDYVVFDIQDVGVRFYTYISTLQYVLESCGEYNVAMIILDRPNPNGHYIDGPILKSQYASFVGMQSVPIVYGMTIGEYAKMIVYEGYLANAVKPNLKIIPCLNYTHNSKVSLSIPPSPNLKSDNAIAHYPSLCLFEGTYVSVGRGTECPFEVYGSPYLKGEKYQYQFTPKPTLGAKNPPFKGEVCFGEDLKSIEAGNKLNLSLIIDAHKSWDSKLFTFFNLKSLFFDKLAGGKELRLAIATGKTEEEIRKTWLPDLITFNLLRKRYLLYEDFPNPFK